MEDKIKARPAKFILNGVESVLVPSFILPEAEQVTRIEAAGFKILEVRNVASCELDDEAISPKLLGKNRKLVSNLVTSYVAVKP